jgi:hypothetical protein
MNIILEIHKDNAICYMAKIEEGSYELREHFYSNEITQYFVNKNVLDMVGKCENLNSHISFHIVHPTTKIFHTFEDFASYVESSS